MPIAVATELISYGKAPEMDVVLDLWLSAIYKDSQVLGSEVGPVAYLRNGTGNPLLNYSDLAQRCSKMWRRSSSSCAPTSTTSASAPTTAAGKRRLRR